MPGNPNSENRLTVEKNRPTSAERFDQFSRNAAVQEIGGKAYQKLQEKNGRAAEIVQRLLRGTANLGKFGVDFIPIAGTAVDVAESGARALGVDLTPDVTEIVGKIVGKENGPKVMKMYDMVATAIDPILPFSIASLDNLIQGVADYVIAGKLTVELATDLLNGVKNQTERITQKRTANKPQLSASRGFFLPPDKNSIAKNPGTPKKFF